jgi:NAD(P)H-nitrite reductase large subunit
MSHHRIVVVGGGIGGVATCAALRAGGYADEVVLVDRAELPYDRPPLSKDYLAGRRDLAGIALQPRQWYADQRIELVGSADVAALDPADGEVTVTLVDGRSYRADHAVLATGGRPALPPVPGRESSRVHALRESADADRLRAALRPGARLLVVGAGLIGAEVAATARGLGTDVVLVDQLDPPLTAAVGRATARWLHDQHREAGIETLATTLESLQETPSGIAAQLTGEEDAREFDAVLIGVGMVPETALAAAAGLGVDRGVLVDERQLTSHPRVLAVGDCSRLRDHRRVGHWEAARHDGERAAATLLGVDPPAATAPWWWSDRHGHHVEAVGTMREPDAEHTVVVRGRIGRTPYAAFTLAGDTVVGAVAIDDPQAVRAARRLIDRGIRVDPDRLADPAVELRALLRG